jgi:hypothetical protein
MKDSKSGPEGNGRTGISRAAVIEKMIADGEQMPDWARSRSPYGEPERDLGRAGFEVSVREYPWD